MLRRLPSVPSFSSLLRPASTSAPSPTSDDPSPTSSRSRSLSTSSALDDALASDIIDIPPVPRIDPSTVARAELIHSLEALQAAKGLEERLQLLAKVQHVLTDQVRPLDAISSSTGMLTRRPFAARHSQLVS